MIVDKASFSLRLVLFKITKKFHINPDKRKQRQLKKIRCEKGSQIIATVSEEDDRLADAKIRSNIDFPHADFYWILKSQRFLLRLLICN